MNRVFEIQEYALNIASAIKEDLLEHLKDQDGNLPEPGLADKIKLQFNSRDYDIDSGNMSHATIYIPEVMVVYSGDNKDVIDALESAVNLMDIQAPEDGEREPPTAGFIAADACDVDE